VALEKPQGGKKGESISTAGRSSGSISKGKKGSIVENFLSKERKRAINHSETPGILHHHGRSKAFNSRGEKTREKKDSLRNPYQEEE